MCILEGIKAVVFDMDGVIRIGNKKIEGAETIFDQLNSKNIKTMIVTNECRYTVKELKMTFVKWVYLFQKLHK